MIARPEPGVEAVGPGPRVGMSQAEHSMNAEQARRAYQFGIVNGIMFAVGVAFIDPVTVLPALVSRLTTSEVAVGSISTIGLSGWFLPQLLTANYLQSRPYKRPLYIFAALLRVVGLMTAVPFLVVLGPSRPGAALVAFFAAYTVYSLAGGLSGPAFLDIVAKTVPGAKLGAFFGHRQFWGALGAIGSGALVRVVLGSERLVFPANYGLLFAAALAIILPGWAIFALIHEPAGKVADDPKPLVPFLREAPSVVRRHREFRLLLVSRLLTGAVGIALPFYIVYARRALAVPESMIGTYVSVQMAGSVLFVPLWAHLNDARGPRQLLTVVTWVYLAASGLALVASLFPGAPGFGRAAFLVVFFPLAAVSAGTFMGYTSFLFAIAPEERRTLYIGVLNTLFALTSFLPLLGGLIVAGTSFSVLFGIATMLAAAAVVATAKLPPAGVNGAEGPVRFS